MLSEVIVTERLLDHWAGKVGFKDILRKDFC